MVYERLTTPSTFLAFRALYKREDTKVKTVITSERRIWMDELVDTSRLKSDGRKIYTLDNHHDGQKPEFSIITSFERFFVTSVKLKWCFKRLVAELTIPYRDETPYNYLVYFFELFVAT